MQVWIVILHDFHHMFTQVPFSPWGEYGQQWFIRKEDTFAIDFVTSLLTSQFSATSENTKNVFVNLKSG